MKQTSIYKICISINIEEKLKRKTQYYNFHSEKIDRNFKNNVKTIKKDKDINNIEG